MNRTTTEVSAMLGGLNTGVLGNWCKRMTDAGEADETHFFLATGHGRSGLLWLITEAGVQLLREYMRANHIRAHLPDGWLDVSDAAKELDTTASSLCGWLNKNADMEQSDSFTRYVKRCRGGLGWGISRKGLVLVMTAKNIKTSKAQSRGVPIVKRKQELLVSLLNSAAHEEVKIDGLPIGLMERLVVAQENTANSLQRLEMLLTPKATLANLPEPLPKNVRADFNEVVRAWALQFNIKFPEAYSRVYREFGKRYHVELHTQANNNGESIIEYAEREGCMHNLLNLALEMFGEPEAWRNVNRT